MAMLKTVARMRLRIALLAVCAAVFSMAPAMAQYGGGGGGQGGAAAQQAQLDKMTGTLSLTPAQVTRIKKIQADGQTQMMALRNDSTIPQDQKRPKMMAMRDAQNKQIRTLLTPAQQPKFDKMLADQRAAMQQRGQ
jgi:protein CpxP